MLQQALADLNAAYRNFLACLAGERNGPRMGPPRFRSRKDRRQAIRFTSNARWQITPSGKLRLPKIGDVPVRWSRALPSAPSSVTVIKDAAGRYFASFVVATEPGPLPETDPVLGIDLGLAHFAVLSDGRKICSPRFLRRAETKLRRAQRALSRKQKGSQNRDKARIKVARAHARVTDARREFHHQLSTTLIRDNQAVAVEDLAVRGLARTRMAKSVYDAGWSAFVAMLEYKARLYGRTFHRVGRFEPTSQVCSACANKDGPKPLHVREWTCRSKTGSSPGAARRSRNPPEATPGHGVTDGIPGLQAEVDVKTGASSPPLGIAKTMYANLAAFAIMVWRHARSNIVIINPDTQRGPLVGRTQASWKTRPRACR